MTKNIITLLAVLPYIFGLKAPLQAQQSITAITYNIRYDNPGDGEDAWPKRREMLAAQLRFYQPDIFGIQEGLERQINYLSEELPAYRRVGVGRDDGKTGGEYSALYFRSSRFGMVESGTFWLSPTPDTVSKGWDAALPRVCTWAHLHDSISGKKIWVFNTHFDHIGKVARAESARLIAAQIVQKNTRNEPVIIMGDLNAEPEEDPIKVLKTNYSEAFSNSKIPPFGPSGTFNGFKFHEPVTRRIDYIFTSKKHWTVEQTAVLSDSQNCHYPSDHLPVLARLSLN